MAEDNLDHWKLLAEEIGAEPSKEEQQAHTTREADAGLNAPSRCVEEDIPREPTAPAVKAVLPPRPAPPRLTPGDWTLLAEELGVEVPPEPEPAPALPQKAAAAPDVAMMERVPPRLPESRVEREPPGPSSRPSEPRKSDLGVTEPRGPAQTARDEDRHGRRRRKRGHRPYEAGERKGRSAAEPFSQTVSPQEEGEGEAVADDDAELLAAPAATPTESKPGEEGGRVRGKRRRRRKGLSPRRQPPVVGEHVETRAPGENGTQASVEPPDREDLEDAEDYEGVEDALEEPSAESEGRSEKSLHRAIPSWLEAVNLLVSANLESRAKNPDRRSGNRPRGGHDRRGRDRGERSR